MDNQKRTENAIDRAEAMTKMLAENVKSDEEDIYIKVSAVVQLLRELSSVNSQHSGDLISREKTLTAFADYVGSGMSMDDYDALWDIVAKMPAVTPRPKTGRWIAYEVRLPDRTILNYRCSVCGRKLIGYSTETLSEAPFCHCGAKMVEPQERSGEE